jgi:hypothetical protein
MFILEIICDIYDAIVENQLITVDNICENEVSILSTSPPGEDSDKPNSSDVDFCHKLTAQVTEMHKSQSLLHPVILITEKDENGRTHTIVAAGANLPALGDKIVTGCVSYPSTVGEKKN